MEKVLLSDMLRPRVNGVLYIPTIRKEPDVTSQRLKHSAELRSPLRLLALDVWLLLKNIRLVPCVFLPLKKKFTAPGVKESKLLGFRDVFMNVILVALELPMLLCLPAVALTFPGWMIATGLAVSYALLRVLSSVGWGTLVVESRDQDVRINNEKWVFLNGIGTSHNMLQNTCDTLSATFKRPITGIHNRSYGIIGDLLECLIQRAFNYQTEDVRVATVALSQALQDDKLEKVVVIAHSQGGLIMSLVLDRMYTGIAPHLFQKLEIYTFGSAAAYFHNPPMQGASTLTPTLTRTNTLSKDILVDNASVTSVASISSRSSRAGTIPTSESPTDLQFSSMGDRSDDPLRMQNKYVPIIEHYCNAYDPVPRWGVLYHILLSTSSVYSGTVFMHQSAAGHLFEQHYLQEMFPTNDDLNNPHQFLNHVVRVDQDAGGLMRAKTVANVHQETKIDESVKEKSRGRTVRELSKLWRYLNGGKA